MRKLTFLFLCITVFTIPWEDFLSIPGVGGLTRIIGYATLFAALLAIADKKTVRTFSTIHYVIIFFLAWNLITIFWSLNASLSFDSSLTYIRVAGLFCIVYEFGYKENEEHWIIKSYIFGCLLAISQVVNGYIKKDYLNNETGGRLTALGMNQNDLALILALGIGLAYYLLQVNKGNTIFWKMIYLSFMPIATMAMLMTGSRAGMISLFVGSVYIVAIQRRVKLRYKVILLVFMAAVFVLSGKVLSEQVYERYTGTGVELSTGSWSDRLFIWESGLKAFDVNPFLGTGSGTFIAATQPFGNEQAPHNAYLAVLVESGLIGFAFYISLFILVFYYTKYIPIQLRDAWRAVLLMLMVGIFSLGWDYRKPPWLLFGLLLNQVDMAKSYKRKAIKANTEIILSR